MALEYMERCLILKLIIYGPNSIEVKKGCKEVSKVINVLLVSHLESDDPKYDTWPNDLFKKAEVLSSGHPDVQAATFNNVACYHRNRGNMHTALEFLQRALRIEQEENASRQNIGSDSSRCWQVADTHLNLCAVLSKMNQHQRALTHANEGIVMLRDHDRCSLDRIVIVATAYYNKAVEHEFLGQFDKSVAALRKGKDIGDKYLPEHAITHKLSEALDSRKPKKK